MSRTLRKQGGLTLIELLLSMAVAALIMVPLFNMLQTMTAASAVATRQAALQRDADDALSHIAARIMAAPVPPMWAGLDQRIENAAVATTFGKVKFFLDASGKVVEAEGAEQRTLAESVASLEFSASHMLAGQPLVDVTLTMSGDDAATAITRVRMGSSQ